MLNNPELVGQKIETAWGDYSAKRTDAAESRCLTLLIDDPAFAPAMHLAGLIARRKGRLRLAEKMLRQAIAIEGERWEYFCDLGVVLRGMSLLPEAMQAFDQALILNPESAAAWSNRGNVFKDLGCFDEAIHSYRRALEFDSGSALTHSALGAALLEVDTLARATESMTEALRLDPAYAEGWNNLGAAFKRWGQTDGAVAAYREALALSPDYPLALHNLGNALAELGDLEGAMRALRRSIELNSEDLGAHSDLLLISQYDPGFSATVHREDLAAFSQQLGEYSPAPSRALPANCLRIGMVSGDFREHPVGYFLEGVLAEFDRNRLDIVLFSTLPVRDALSERLISMGFPLESLVGLNDAAAADLIRAHDLDVLLDLSGHTAHNRLGVFARRPVPVQVTWLGYFASTGLPAIDFILSDPYSSPDGSEQEFVETLWRLPETRMCFTPPSQDVPVLELPALKNGRITFGCFNNLTKLNEQVIATWSAILTLLPEARLCLKTRQFSLVSQQERVRNQFEALGISGERLVLEGASEREAYFDAYHQIDIALDPFPFTGGTTTMEGLWMGVPVVTLAGGRMVARQGVSILHNLGLGHWVAGSKEAYVAIACKAASNLVELAELRASLRQRLITSPLCDAKRFARHFEHALFALCELKVASNNEGASADDRSGVAIHSSTSIFSAAVVAHQSGDLAEAERLYRLVLDSDPHHADAWHMFGVLAGQVGQSDLACSLIDEAVKLNPVVPAYYNNLGVVLNRCGKHDVALAQFRWARVLQPDYVDAIRNMGAAYQAQGDAASAVACYQQALSCGQEHPDIHNNLGVLASDAGMVGDAIEHFRRAEALSPGDIEIQSNFASALKDQGDIGAAIARYRRALQLAPTNMELRSNFLMALHYDHLGNPAAVAAEHFDYGQVLDTIIDALPPDFSMTRQTGDRLKIGFVSGDLYSHPVGFFLESVLSHFDLSVFDIVLYTTQLRQDALTDRLKAMGFPLVSLVGIDDALAVESIRADGIEVLVDLSGHTAHHRLGVFARRAAPVQVSWLGYFATTGVRQIDYLIADPLSVPADESSRFVEQVWRMPETRLCFTPPAESTEPGDLPALVAGYVTFGCFNNLSKLNDAVLTVWSKILLSVSGSRLYLKAKQLNDPQMRALTFERLEALGVASARVTLEGWSERSKYFEAYRAVDIALDPFPFTGGTTSVEALWMGVPVITRRGESLLARQGECLLRLVGLDDWIASDEAAYVRLAVQCADDLPKLALLRGQLRSRLQASPVCDAAKFAQALGGAFQGIWAACQDSQRCRR